MPKLNSPAPKRRSRKTRLFSVLICAPLLLGIAMACFGLFQPRQAVSADSLLAPSASLDASPAPTVQATPEPTPEPTPTVATVKFSATGDNLIHKPIYTQAARRASDGEKYSFDYCYAGLTEFYAQQDINWINQETLCTNELEPSTYPCFSTPGECAEALYHAGIRVFSLANNHTYDKGAKGIAATLRFWDSMPQDTVTAGLWRGESDYDNIPLQTVNGVTIAYLSYTEHTNGIQQSSAMTANVIYTSQTDIIERQVKLAAQQADFVIVGVHWGTEDSHTITQAQRTLAQQLADWGADVIVGTHPHVLQDAQWLTAQDGRQAFVAYSLGNFLSTQSKPDQLIGAILTIELQKVTQPDGTVELKLLSPKLHPTVTHYDTGKSNLRACLYSDYTPELAKAHGVRAAYSYFDYDYIAKVASENISAEFLEAA